MSDESIKSPSKSTHFLNPLLDYFGTKARVEFKGSCFKEDKISLNHGKIVNIYIVYEINKNFKIDTYPTLENCLFCAINLAKHPNIDQHKYSGYGIGFDRKGSFSLSDEIGKNVTIFGVDMSSSPHIVNKKKDFLVLGKGPTQGLEHTLTAGKLYSIKCTKNNTIFCLSLHRNGENNYLFVNCTEIINSKTKDSEIVAYLLYLGNISKDFKINKCVKINSCNNINYPIIKSRVSDVAKNINVRVFNLMSRNNETRHIAWVEAWKCKCRLDASVYNNEQCWNNDKCRRECKEFITKGIFDKRFIWNPSSCEFECDKSCNFEEYLGYKNYKGKKMLIDRLVEECSENFDENKLISVNLNNYKNVRGY